jgi:hypothetical protein
MNWTVPTVALLLMSLSGCILTRDGTTAPPVQWPLQQAQVGGKSITLNVIVGEQPKGEKANMGADALLGLRSQAVKAYTTSGLFSSVLTDGEPADLIADIVIIEKGSEGLSWSAALSTVTFTLIPGRVPQELTVKTEYKNRDRKVIGYVEKHEELGFWIEFFLLFAMPFADGPNTVMNAAQYDLQRLTIGEAHVKGLF